MVISWYGQACFKIQSGDLVVIIDPFAREIGLTPPRFRSDIALITHDHPDHANVDTLTGDPFLIRGPGEYEIKDAYIYGIRTYHDTVEGAERGLNTAYRIELEGIKLLHMGDFGEDKIRDETLEQIGTVDILMIPTGGTYTINAEKAANITKQIDPRIVIPMHYKIPGLKAPLEGVEMFLKEMGARDAQPQDKLTLKKKDIAEPEKTSVVILKTM